MSPNPEGGDLKKHRTCKQIFLSFTHPQPLDGVKRSKHFLSESPVAFQIKRKELEHFASKMFDLMHTPDLFGWVKRSGIEIARIGIVYLTT